MRNHFFLRYHRRAVLAANLAVVFASLIIPQGCRSAKPQPEIQETTRTLDYRNGWYHWATGAETIRDISTLYHRDPDLVAELNRARVGGHPAQGSPIWVPPVEDRAQLALVLERINANPRSVPISPPKPEMLVNGSIETEQPDEPEPNSAVPPAQPLQFPRAILPPIRRDITARQLDRSSELARPGGSSREVPARKADSGLFGWPVQGKVIQLFSLTENSMSRGITIEAQAGEPVSAARDGKVVFAGALQGYGNVVLVEHGDGFISVYGYNEMVLVKDSQKVMAGQQIARVGRPSASAEGQLFFQVRRNAEPVDPLAYLPH